MPSAASPQAFSLVSGTPAGRETSGRRLSLAAAPGLSNTAPSATRTSSSGMPSPIVSSASGIAATASALSTSATMLDRRRPTRSINAPPNTAEKAIGATAAAPASPANAALPVFSRTSHGTATATMLLAVIDRAVEPSTPASGINVRRDRGVSVIRAPQVPPVAGAGQPGQAVSTSLPGVPFSSSSSASRP